VASIPQLLGYTLVTLGQGRSPHRSLVFGYVFRCAVSCRVLLWMPGPRERQTADISRWQMLHAVRRSAPMPPRWRTSKVTSAKWHVLNTTTSWENILKVFILLRNIRHAVMFRRRYGKSKRIVCEMKQDDCLVDDAERISVNFTMEPATELLQPALLSVQ
jgi:hypothetical protein